MANTDLVTSIASLPASACAAWWLPGVVRGRGKLFGAAGPANVRLAACVHPARFPFPWRVGDVQQMGPSPDRVGPGNDLPKTPMGPQRDLFGTPFGPLFPIQTGAKYANLPEIQRNLVGGSEVCTKKRASRARGFWRRAAARNGGEAFPAQPFPDGPRSRRGAFFLGSPAGSPPRIGGESGVASALLRVPPERWEMR